MYHLGDGREKRRGRQKEREEEEREERKGEDVNHLE